MKSFLAAFAFLVLLSGGQVANGGSKIPQITLFDDAGRSRLTDSLSGQITVLLPMYTRCMGACSTNVASLRSALNKTDVDLAKTRILLFSFDPAETSANLASYRKSQNLPLSWLLARSDEAGTRKLMDWLGYPYSKEQGQYLHRNSAFVVSPDLSAFRELADGRYSALELETAIHAAATHWRSELLDGILKYGFAVAVFATVCLSIYLSYLLGRLRRYRMSVAAKGNPAPQS